MQKIILLFVLLLITLYPRHAFARVVSVPTYHAQVVFTRYDPFDIRQAPGNGITRSGLRATIPAVNSNTPMYVAAARSTSKYFGKLYYANLRHGKARLTCFLYVIDTGNLSPNQIDIAVNGKHIKRVSPFMSWKGNLRYFKLKEIASFVRPGKKYREGSLPDPRKVEKRIKKGEFNYMI